MGEVRARHPCEEADGQMEPSFYKAGPHCEVTGPVLILRHGLPLADFLGMRRD